MRDIALYFLHKKNSALPVCQKNETRQDADKNLRRKKIDCPTSDFFWQKRSLSFYA